MNTVFDNFDGILLDAYGVFWGGNDVGLLPGAKEAMEMLVSSKKIVGILTNTTQLSHKEIEKLSQHGLHLNTHFHFLLTSGDIAKQFFVSKHLPLSTKNKKYFPSSTAHPSYSHYQTLFENTPFTEAKFIDEADFIYITIPHIDGADVTDPAKFHPLIERFIPTGLPMVCANPDLFAHEGNPPKAVVRQGTIARLYENASGQVVYLGKPSRIAFESALSEFKRYGIASKDAIVMVGDTPETDIRGARNIGMASILLTQTGMMAGRTPSTIQSSDAPTYYMERFKL